MATRVFLHIGLPKTGTTYLQQVLWKNKDELGRQGVLLPGFGPRQHLWASAVVREEKNIRQRHADAPHAWAALTRESVAWPGPVVISHEFLAAASAEQAKDAVNSFGAAEVHLILTARDTLSLVTARWQEFVKNGATTPIDSYPASDVTDPQNAWDWGTMDLADVLRRWGTAVPADRVHIVTLPKPSEPHQTLWLRFAALLQVDPSKFDAANSAANESLGVVEVELLRRVNRNLQGFDKPLDRGLWIRGYLAQNKLASGGREKFWPSPERVQQLRERGDAAAAFVEQSGFQVYGDLADLRTPTELPTRRHPDAVSDTEILDVASATIASMLADVRDLRRERRALREELAAEVAERKRLQETGLRGAVVRRYPWLRPVLQRKDGPRLE